MKKSLSKHLNIGKVLPVLMMIYDAFAAPGAYFIVLLLRHEGLIHIIDKAFWESYKMSVPFYMVLTVSVFYLFKMYNVVWKFAGFDEMIRVTFGSTVASVIYSVVITVEINIRFGDIGYKRMPFTFYLFGFCLQLLAVVAIRLVGRFIYTNKKIAGKKVNGMYVDRIMLVGGGEAGMLILRALKEEKNVHEKICCIIDDDRKKWGKYIEGVRVVGGRDDIPAAVKKYKIDKIYVAIPSATEEEEREILAVCTQTDCRIKNLPGAYLSMSGEITSESFRDVSLEDLLGRRPINPDMEEIFGLIQGKTILVTGGGGSIGSELCRQIAAHKPACLIIFDVYENNAYDIQLELEDKYPQLNLITLIGSVRDSRRINEVFEKYHPDIVYHAAAHKHVPLMEDSPCEAIKNNVIGTYKTAYAAMANNCRRFVLISTDKAVNPTNVMGASKRLCEMVIQFFDHMVKEGKADRIANLYTHYEGGTQLKPIDNPSTEFVAVRFGNVLGSNGSVIPLFKKQIEQGGPVTVTHPEIIRYFMTIPEAVSLVLLAGSYAKGGEIFVLDMGSPVKIDTLARNLIKLSGLKPDVDIKIEYTGLRPGEKLYEEKLMAEEGLRKTDNDLIHIGQPVKFDYNEFEGKLSELMDSAYGNNDNIRDLIVGMVPTYVPGSH